MKIYEKIAQLLGIDSLKLYFSKECKLYEYNKGTVYSRFIYTGKYLKKKHFIMGYGQCSELINKVHKARVEYNKTHTLKLPINDQYRDTYDNRTGYYIDGTKIETRIHALHSKQLVNKKTGVRYIIDTITYQNWFGKYMEIGMRQEGSRSHKHIIWENFTSKNPMIVKNSKQNLELYEVVNKTYIE